MAGALVRGENEELGEAFAAGEVEWGGGCEGIGVRCV